MKKLLILAVLLAVGTAQADVRYWAPNVNGGDAVSWSDANNFMNASAANAPGLPGAADHVIIDQNWAEWGGAPGTMPLISTDVGAVDILTPGWGFAGTSGLTIADGGSISVANFARLGQAAGGIATLDMTGGYMVSAILHVGFYGDGIVNMSGNSLLHLGNLGMGEMFALGGTGIINMGGNARMLVNGDHTGAAGSAYLGNGYIQAINAGESINEEFVTENGWTEYTVIPEPATLGLFALLGSGLVWFRKRVTS